jgi:aspartate aminotransferase
MFVDISDALSLDGFRTSAEFARALLDEMRVAVTPGEAFDAPGFIRLSYATSMDNLREGSRRLLEFIGPHVPTPQPVG